MVEMAPGTALASVGLLLLLSRGPFAHAGENSRELTTKPCVTVVRVFVILRNILADIYDGCQVQ